ncbi:hypothetical protein GP486_005569 [Trichoglossum hirsutum]|uniref:Uncharacterized protein n=1 Tax=Trichoglossum hirsutum TaxID=265104 RepID=A0A9P8L903_9PEZI|nr:hypothetical protein GP486_005569 [Trichoglossum hirsutum]
MLMASESSPLAFLPSPATTVSIAVNENFPPLSPTQAPLPVTASSSLARPSIQTGFRKAPPDALSSNGKIPTVVSPNYQPARKTLSGPVPRPPLPSLPLASSKLSTTSSNIIPTSFVDQSRAFEEQQRRVFEQERSLFAQERELWETERQALYERIKELELALQGVNGFGKKTSQSAIGRPSIDTVSTSDQLHHRGESGNAGTSGSPCSQATQNIAEEKFWEGPSSHRNSATRTFSPPPKVEERCLSSASESRSRDLSKSTERPELRAHRQSEGGVHFLEPTPKTIGSGIDISLIEKGLDGISLKASSLPPAILAKVRSPPPVSPGVHSPSSGNNSSGMSPVGLLNLKKDAGHTPPAPGRYSAEDSEQATPKQPEHIHRTSVAYPPPDDLLSDSPVEVDKALTAPLGMTNDEESDAAFLNQLDTKLLQEAHKTVFTPSETSSTSEEETVTNETFHQQEPEIKIRFKRSVNFGSAFGSTGFGSEA